MNSASQGEFPKLFYAVVCLNAVLLGWLWWHGLPRSTSDIVAFKQPAYMRLHSPYFSLPSYVGQPHSDKLNSYPSCVYTYANYMTFRIFGFSLYSSLGFDLFIHFLLSVLGGCCIWKATARSDLAAIFVIGTLQLILPIGRPEELGILLVMFALLSVEKGLLGVIFAAVFLGATGVTAPGTAIVGTVLVVSYAGFRRSWDKQFFARALLVTGVAPLLSAIIYAAFNWSFLKEAIEQHQSMVGSKFYAVMDVSRLVQSSPAYVAVTLLYAIATVCIGIIAVIKKPRWFPRNSPAGAFVLASGIAVWTGIVVNVWFGRLIYDYRHILVIGLSSSIIGVSLLQASILKRHCISSGILKVLLVLFSLSTIRDLGRFTLVPFTWDKDSVRYEDAIASIRKIVPLNASVGGDGSAWTIIDDGRPYLAIRHATSERDLPEYVIGLSWASPAQLLQGRWGEAILNRYEEITRENLPAGGAFVGILDQKIPIARGRSDWHMRVWRKRT